MPIRRERIALRQAGTSNRVRQGDEGTVLEVSVASDGQAIGLDGLTVRLLGNNPELLQLEGVASITA